MQVSVRSSANGSSGVQYRIEKIIPCSVLLQISLRQAIGYSGGKTHGVSADLCWDEMANFS